MNQLFWTGVVEDTHDTYNIGIYKVRIFGIHTDNLNLLPTSDLPDATALIPSNSSKMFSTFVEGDHVFGYYPPGTGTQSPVIIGTTPGILTEPWDITKGFSPQSKNPIQTDKPNGLGGPGNLNVPTTGAASRGDIANTNIAITNANLSHACDFKYVINLPKLDIGLGTLVNPVAAIQDAIRSGKNKAAQIMSLIMVQLSSTLQAVINAIVSSLGLDATGQVSLAVSVAKDIFVQINAITKKIAMIAETASLYYNLVKDITTIVNYIKSLPARLLAVVQGCITQFLGSVQNFIKQIEQIPGLATSNIDSMLSQLGLSTQNALNAATSAQIASNTSISSSNTTTANTGSLFDLVNITLYKTDADHANLIMDFINTNFQNANVTVAGHSSSSTFDRNTLQSP